MTLFRVHRGLFRVPGTPEMLAGVGLFRVFRVFRVSCARARGSVFFYAPTHKKCFPRAYKVEHPEHPEQSSRGAALRCSGYPEQQQPTRNSTRGAA